MSARFAWATAWPSSPAQRACMAALLAACALLAGCDRTEPAAAVPAAVIRLLAGSMVKVSVAEVATGSSIPVTAVTCPAASRI